MTSLGRVAKGSLRRTPLYPLLRRIRGLIRPPVHGSLETPEQAARMHEFYGHLFAPEDLCFDVGANVGNRVAAFRALRARVVAIEPQSACAGALRERFGDDPDIEVVHVALGAKAGSAEIFVSNASTLSSMNPEWIRAVRRSGRFSGYRWSAREAVEVTTLDALIDSFGVPRFIKIDVEGFEAEVIAGLSQLVPCVSIEFTPEFLTTTESCIRHLASLGRVELNYSIGESMELALTEWIAPDDAILVLRGMEGQNSLFGDVYIRPIAPPP